MELPTSGSEAKRLGVSKYFTGRPCHLDHVAPRYTRSGVCTDCAVVNAARHRLLPQTTVRSKEYYKRVRAESPEKIMWNSAKARAKKLGIPFAITPGHILEVWPADDVCPVFGEQMVHNFDSTGYVSEMSPTLDRNIPELGYVRGNIIVMSQRANRLKSSETDPDVFLKMASWLQSMKGA